MSILAKYTGCLPRRWEMATLLFTGSMVLYLLRVNISVAISDMGDELGWNDAQKGYVLSAFYWGYAIGQIPASILTQYIPAKHIFGISILLQAFLTLFVPACCRSSYGLALFIRMLIGIIGSVSFPAYYVFIPIWIPLSEKNIMLPFMDSGVYLGSIVGFAISGSLLDSTIVINGYDYGSWPSCFYIFGLIGILWYPIFYLLSYETPNDHPYISEQEKELINQGKDYTTIDLDASIHSGGVYGSLDGNNMTNNNDMTFNDMNDSTRDRLPSISQDEFEASTHNNNASTRLDRSASSPKTPRKKSSSQPPLPTSSPSSSPAKSNPTLGQTPQTPQTPIVTRDARTPSNPLTLSQRPIAITSLGKNMASHKMSSSVKMDGHQSGKYTPGRHRTISIAHEADHTAAIAQQIPWLNFFIHPVSFTLMVCSWTSGWISFTLLSLMPTYLTDELKYSQQTSSVLCMFPYLALFVSMITYGEIFEHLNHHAGWTTNTIRRVSLCISFGGATIGLVICGFVNEYHALSYIFLILAQAAFGAIETSLSCAFSDVAPHYSSSINSIGNTFAALAGIVGPIIFSNLISAFPGIIGWRIGYLITLGLALLSLALWLTYQTAEIVPELNLPLDEQAKLHAKQLKNSERNSKKQASSSASSSFQPLNEATEEKKVMFAIDETQPLSPATTTTATTPTNDDKDIDTIA